MIRPFSFMFISICLFYAPSSEARIYPRPSAGTTVTDQQSFCNRALTAFSFGFLGKKDESNYHVIDANNENFAEKYKSYVGQTVTLITLTDRPKETEGRFETRRRHIPFGASEIAAHANALGLKGAQVRQYVESAYTVDVWQPGTVLSKTLPIVDSNGQKFVGFIDSPNIAGTVLNIGRKHFTSTQRPGRGRWNNFITIQREDSGQIIDVELRSLWNYYLIH